MNLTSAFVSLWGLRTGLTQSIGATDPRLSFGIDVVILGLSGAFLVVVAIQSTLALLSISKHLITILTCTVITVVLSMWVMFVYDQMSPVPQKLRSLA